MDLLRKLPSSDCHWTSLMTSQQIGRHQATLIKKNMCEIFINRHFVAQHVTIIFPPANTSADRPSTQTTCRIMVRRIANDTRSSGNHYDDVIMTTIASQITSLTSVYSTVYSDADQRKHQSSASLAFVRGIHRDRWILRTKGQLRGKCFHLMTSSCRNDQEYVYEKTVYNGYW